MIRISNNSLRIPEADVDAVLLQELCRGRKDRPFCFFDKGLTVSDGYVTFDFWYAKFWEDLYEIIILISRHTTTVQIHQFLVFDTEATGGWEPLTVVFGAGGENFIGAKP
jgi:hypothetical protein